ncbi:MAG: family 78 glycoside hydrolase catalytic domain [Sphaerochaetaceae bacterium]|nr:family 78 glycoside hydrolase catalytic domain [Sphaerochaetaceae bacterium]
MASVHTVSMNHSDTAVGISESPRFSWVIESPFRNCVQSGYQLQIAGDSHFTSILADTGMVDSEDSAHVEVDAFVPEQGRVYYARVRVRTDSDGETAALSGFSPPGKMIGGLKDPDVLKDYFITAEQAEDIRKARGTYLRKEFTVDKKKIASAIIYSSAQGNYQLMLNGRRVSTDELAPGWTSYDERLLYQSYDVSELLNVGTNVVGAHVGAGWYKSTLSFLMIHNFYGDYASLSLLMVITYTDGSIDTVASDVSWKGDYSPVFNAQLYDGETYDAREEQDGWSMAGFDDRSWRPAVSTPCTSKRIESQIASPVTLHEYMSPTLAFTTPRGERVIDFGQNMSALVEITGQGKRGDTIVLRMFEVLDKDGNVYTDNLRSAEQRITYTIRDDNPFFYRPHFTFFGFRFIHVEVWPGRADLDNFAARAIYSDMGKTGHFECSNPSINQLQHNIEWGLKSNFVDVPTDCPQRDERLGWTGDAQIFCRTASFNVNSYAFFSKWLRDLALDQTPEGGVGHVVPDVLNKYPVENPMLKNNTHSAAAWGDAAVINPWVMYLTYGDTEILERQWDSMKAWIDFMKDHSEGHIWNYRLQFGDWVALDAEEGSYFGATPNDLTCTAYYAYSTGLFVKIARVLARDSVADEYDALQRDIIRTFRSTFFTEDGEMTVQTQTAHILALHFDLVSDEHRQRTFQRLKELLEKEGGHLVTGFVGTPYFTHALSANGGLTEAYDLLLKDDFPSWLYQVRKGATTIWEHWDGIKPDGSMWSPEMNSFNHYAYGAIGEWLYRVVAGLEIDEASPGYKHSIIAPKIGGDLTRAEGSFRSIYGEVRSSWNVEIRQKRKHVTLTVSVPVNTSSSIRLMDGAVLVDGDGLVFAQRGEVLEAEAGSGTYRIRFTL